MKILLTGGGSGGHFYPLIAVAEEINRIAHEERILKPELYFVSDSPYDERALFEADVTFRRIISGKLRRYFSIQNFFDIFKSVYGSIRAIFTVFDIYPDVIFSKGGYASFPVLLASRIFRIPVFIHESDSVPGRTNSWAGKFAKRIAVSFAEAASHFPEKKVAWTGNPIRQTLMELPGDAHTAMKLNPSVPTILVLGGSLGSEKINESVLDALGELVRNYQIIHQTGKNNYKTITQTSGVILKENQFRSNYVPLDYLDTPKLKIAAACADIIISRAGSTIFEIAQWGKPAILIPITDSNGDHQRKNAAIYAKAGACSVIEETNLRQHILLAEIARIIENPQIRERMSGAAKRFSKPDAATKIAREIINLALKHEA